MEIRRVSFLARLAGYFVHTDIKKDWMIWLLSIAYLLYFSIGQLPAYSTITLWVIMPLAFVIILIHYVNNTSKLPLELILYLCFFLWAGITGAVIHVDSSTFYPYLRRVFICLLLMVSAFVAMRSSGNIGIFMLSFFLSTLFICGHSLFSGDLFAIINQDELYVESEGEIIVSAERLDGIVGNANGMGAYVILGFIALSYIFFETSNKFIKVFYIMSGILFFYTLLAAGTRGGLIMSAFYILIWALIALKYKVQSKLTLPILLVGLFLGGFYVYDTIISKSTVGLRVSNQGSFKDDKRAHIIEDAYNVFKDNPITGVGLDQFQYYSVDDAIAHNEYLEVMADTGIVGSLLYFPIFYIVGKRLMRYRKIFLELDVVYNMNFLLSILLLMFLYGTAKQHLWDYSYLLLIGIMIGYTHYLKNKFKLNV